MKHEVLFAPNYWQNCRTSMEEFCGCKCSETIQLSTFVDVKYFPILSLIKKVFLRQIEQKFSSRKKQNSTEQTRSTSQVSVASAITFFHENQFADRKKYFFYEKTFFTLCEVRMKGEKRWEHSRCSFNENVNDKAFHRFIFNWISFAKNLGIFISEKIK